MTKRKLRKQLNRQLSVAVYNAMCGTQYHTSSPPEHGGYIIKDAAASELRRIAAELKELNK